MRAADAFEAELVSHRNALLRFARMRTRDASAAEDLVQDTLMLVLS